ncbi:MAG: hypothetical protein IKZ71_08025 [Bacteroidales bacterium]|nr:hypothetical protein [Bacteroidales bacterium]
MTDVQIYKMSGAGNDFVVLDGRGVDMSEFRRVERIRELCAEFRTDGLMILDDAGAAEGPAGRVPDFRMEFYNPDGSGGMMCGNGGRCIVAFADWLGVKASAPDHYVFLAPDGLHSATIVARPTNGRMDGNCPLRACPPPDMPPQKTGVFRGPRFQPFGMGPDGDKWSETTQETLGGAGATEGSEVPQGAVPAESDQWTVRLGMIDVDGVREMLGGYFLNTGTRHFVKFVEDVDAVDIEKEGKELRWNEAFAPEGTNVNFVQRCGDYLKVRTFEKGVEGETLACGTGITACAIVSGVMRIQARRGDMLEVDFEQVGPESFRNIHLTGPAEFCKI